VTVTPTASPTVKTPGPGHSAGRLIASQPAGCGPPVTGSEWPRDRHAGHGPAGPGQTGRRAPGPARGHCRQAAGSVTSPLSQWRRSRSLPSLKVDSESGPASDSITVNFKLPLPQ
jgi:hypothetical protein